MTCSKRVLQCLQVISTVSVAVSKALSLGRLYREGAIPGIDMTRDIEDRLRLFASIHAGADAHRIAIDRLALNWDQVEQYDPPPNPAKLSDSRAAGYVAEYGDDSWELDALEPTVIGRLIQDAVFALRDVDRWSAAVEKQESERETMTAIMTAIAERWDDVQEFLS